jgi:hypothetical protein
MFTLLHLVSLSEELLSMQQQKALLVSLRFILMPLLPELLPIRMETSKNGSMPLTVSAVGYYSVTLAHLMNVRAGFGFVLVVELILKNNIVIST